jgi:hypothetical protein
MFFSGSVGYVGMNYEASSRNNHRPRHIALIIVFMSYLLRKLFHINITITKRWWSSEDEDITANGQLCFEIWIHFRSSPSLPLYFLLIPGFCLLFSIVFMPILFAGFLQANLKRCHVLECCQKHIQKQFHDPIRAYYLAYTYMLNTLHMTAKRSIWWLLAMQVYSIMDWIGDGSWLACSLH